MTEWENRVVVADIMVRRLETAQDYIDWMAAFCFANVYCFDYNMLDFLHDGLHTEFVNNTSLLQERKFHNKVRKLIQQRERGVCREKR